MQTTEAETQAAARRGLYSTLWRWHFYAGLFVLPFILILSVTGSIYLFKPQIDRWEERAFQRLDTRGAVSADQQLAAVMRAYPGARFNRYRLPESPDDAAMIQIALPDGHKREIYVSPQGAVLGGLNPDKRIEAVIFNIHGNLLLGPWGDHLVELAASWTIVMILTGLYLWWPRPFRLAGTVWPRLSLKGRAVLKDWHRVIGVWVSVFVLVMLASGLPWAGVWGGAFKWVRAEMGWVKGPADWKIGSDAHSHHNGMAMTAPMATALSNGLPLSFYVSKAKDEHMAFPVFVLPPHAPQTFGPPNGDDWMVKSEAQNRLLDRSVSYDASSGRETRRRSFADQHVIDRVINTGVAWHEGQLFGWPNQLMGLLMAIGLIATSIFGVLTWLKRRPKGQLGAPPTAKKVEWRWLLPAVLVLGLLLPLFGASALLILALDRIITLLYQRHNT